MRKYICCGIIFLYCLILRITMDISPMFFLCMFLSLFLNFLLFLLHDTGRYFTYALWLLAVWIQPEFLWFLPMLFLHSSLHFIEYFNSPSHLWQKRIEGTVLLAACISLFSHAAAFPVNTIPAFVFAILLSIFFAWLTVSYEQLHYQFIHTMDEHTEQQILLKEINQALLAKQDAEIHAATLKERNRIAREIHDNVGHLLSRSLLMTGAIQTINQSEELQIPLQQLDASLNQAMTTIRDSVHNLHDESLNLEEAAKQLVQDFQFCPVSLTYDMGYEPPTKVRYTFLSITKEALSNIIKHSNATNIRIIMREHPSMYQLEIADNGTRIDSSFASEKGIGLTNMRERVSQLQGTIRLYTEHGFRIFIIIPKTQ